MIIKRSDYLDRIRPFFNTSLIKIITGIRRSGKSVLLRQIREELINSGVDTKNIIYYNFEDYNNRDLLDTDKLYLKLKEDLKNINGQAYLLLDEIQEVKSWERVINSFRSNGNVDIYITGSNARLLSSDLSTYLTGRYIEINIYPFTFSEFLELYQVTHHDINTEQAFREYLVLGGMPFLSEINYNPESSKLYLEELYNSIILRDIITKYKIRDSDLLNRITMFILDNLGHPFSANSIQRFFKNEGRNVTVDTILNYLEALSSAFLIMPAKRNDLTGKKILSVNEKYYTADHGIRNAILNSSANINQILENIVFLELKKRNFNVTIGKVGEKEIDFIAEKDGKRMYIQVCYLLSSEKTIDREFGAFKRIKDNYPKYVLSLDEFDLSRDGIIHKNIRDFLLDKTWSEI